MLSVAASPALVAFVVFVFFKRRRRLSWKMWERLATAADELHALPDQTSIVHAAARSVLTLTGATAVDIELWGVGQQWLVRLDWARLVYDGPVSEAPAAPAGGYTAHCAVAGRTSGPVGVIRVHMGAAALTGLQRSVLRTLGMALATALSNVHRHDRAVEQAQRAEQLARRDALTGLPNRRGLLDLLNEQLRRAAVYGPALAILDLDGFKGVNDTLGHVTGDQLLVDVAARLAAAAKHVGAFVGRLGGDEFAIGFSTSDVAASAVSHAEAVVGCLDEPFDVHGMSLVVRGSTGVAVGEQDIDAEELLRRADVAMYQAKRGRVQTVLYREEVDRGVPHRVGLSRELGRALAAGEIGVWVQPVVHLGTGEVVGCEAVPHWQHPRHGRLEPSGWLELAENSAHVATVTEYVLDQAVGAAARWRKLGMTFPVSLNIPQRCLFDVRFPHTVLARLRMHNLEPHDLIVELSETAGISPAESVREALTSLRRAGVRIVADRFGASYSTLSVLTRLPSIDGLKVDPELVAALPGFPRNRLTVQAAVRLGKDLGISHAVGAEGVSTAAQRQLLYELGCVTGQGPLFAAPLPSEEAVRLLRDRQDDGGVRLASPIQQLAAAARVRQGVTA
ncbi:putative bifunctional diguanylate cyclase/phosphodiesterase [Micromonospora sp. CPCC 206061]|uniref:putative bifunctional diguanylate cyclase/phosphodiesterase n=1 Tax=Micromonospora sp. CPCC 206061 TaxID=3122410 RepID=UPI002FEF0945